MALSPIYDLGQASRYNCDMGRIDSGRDSYISPMLPISYLATLLIKHQPCNGGAAEDGLLGSESLDHRHGTGMNQAWTRRGPGVEQAGRRHRSGVEQAHTGRRNGTVRAW